MQEYFRSSKTSENQSRYNRLHDHGELEKFRQRIAKERGNSCDEELPVLPRHTRVVVTGNNRTKSVLVGLHGVVKKAVGLGGWHWLVLTNGIEVKLQRNALSVVEAPGVVEAQGAEECENFMSSSSELASENFQRCSKVKLRSQRTIASVSKSIKNYEREDHSTDTSVVSSENMLSPMNVDLSKLETPTLWRYWKHFKLEHVAPNPSKDQLIEIVQRHFMTQQLDELQVISGFVQAANGLKAVYS